MDAPHRDFDLEERLLEYATGIVRLPETMRRTQAGIHVAGQLLRSGISPLPNHGEAQAAESAADFVLERKLR
jgi:four helix bundle protein